MKTLLYMLNFLILSIFIISCENEETYLSDYDLIVVEGYLYPDKQVDSLHLTFSLPFDSDDTVFLPVTDAQVNILWNNNSFLLNNIGNGYYSFTGNGLQIEQGNDYFLSIIYNNQEITSHTSVPEIPENLEMSDTVIYIDTTFSFGPPGFFDSTEDTTEDAIIEFTWDNPNNDYFYVIIENADSNATEIEYEENNFMGNGPRPGNFMFRSEPFKRNYYIVNDRFFEEYGKHKIKVYRVNQEYADLYENRQQDSRNLSEPLTNIENGLGIFTAFSYTEGYFYVRKLE